MIGIKFVLNTLSSPSLEYLVFANTIPPIFSDENESEGGKFAFEDLTIVRSAGNLQLILKPGGEIHTT